MIDDDGYDDDDDVDDDDNAIYCNVTEHLYSTLSRYFTQSHTLLAYTMLNVTMNEYYTCQNNVHKDERGTSGGPTQTHGSIQQIPNKKSKSVI